MKHQPKNISFKSINHIFQSISFIDNHHRHENLSTFISYIIGPLSSTSTISCKFSYNFLGRVDLQYSSKDRSDGCFKIVHLGHKLLATTSCKVRGKVSPLLDALAKYLQSVSYWVVFWSHFSLCSSVSFFCNCVELLPSPRCLKSLITLT